MSRASSADVADARRVLCMGATGSGKSTLAAGIGRELGLPVEYVDELGWLPGWGKRDHAEFEAIVRERLAGDAWVIDSLWGSVRHLGAARADLVVALDYPRMTSLARLVRRTLRRIVTREPVCNGNVETLGRALSRDSILRWHATSWAPKRRAMRALAADPAAPPVLLLARPRDARRLLEELRRRG